MIMINKILMMKVVIMGEDPFHLQLDNQMSQMKFLMM